MVGITRLGAAAAFGAMLAAAFPAAHADILPEADRYLPVWLGSAEAADAAAEALLSIPPGWEAGDPAVVLARGGDWPPGTREDLVAALRETGVAVLQFVGHSPPAGAGEAVMPNLARALRMMHEAFAAGAVIALGKGEGGEAAIAAAAAIGASDGRRFAAAALLGPGNPEFRAGEPPSGFGWASRAPRICDVLTAARPDLPADLKAACLSRLIAGRR